MALTVTAQRAKKNVPGCQGNNCPAGPTQILPTWDEAWAGEMRKDAIEGTQGESDLTSDDGPIKKRVIQRRQAAARWSIVMWVTFFLVIAGGLIFAFWNRLVLISPLAGK